MPTVFSEDGVRCVIYPNDHSPPHLHALGADWESLNDGGRFKATEKWIERELSASRSKAIKRGARRRLKEPHALSARYDEKSGRIVVDLTNGAQFAFPPEMAQGLAGAKKSALKTIVVSPAGTGLHWPRLDADLTVRGLLAGMFGSRMWMRELASRGGKTVSPKKAAAARANGAKGGRPRLREAA